jgi:hypothetical protein
MTELVLDAAMDSDIEVLTPRVRSTAEVPDSKRGTRSRNNALAEQAEHHARSGDRHGLFR